MKKTIFSSFLIILFILFSSGNLAYAQNDMDPLEDGFNNSSTDTTTSNINEDEIDQGEWQYTSTEDEEDVTREDYNANNDFSSDWDGINNEINSSSSSSSSSYYGLPGTPLASVLSGVLNWMLGILGTLALISFAISGIMYFFAIGDENQVTKAKTMTLYSIIGIIVALSGFIIIKALNSILQGGTMF